MTAPASPYVGAEPLSHDNPIFGRDREIRDLYFLLSKERIALLYSPSGAGKSSILYASEGLLDRFVDRFDVLPVTRVNTETKLPGANRYALSMLLGLERFAEEPRKDSELASLSLRDAVIKRPGQSEGLLTMIVVDQFEEIVRIDPTDLDGKREFFRQLGELLAEPSIWALFVLREDFVATLDPYIRQLPTHFKNRYRIDLLKPEEAVKAIAGPAKDLERKWTDEAAKILADNLAAETGFVEPMHLQIVCHDIWSGMRADDMVVDPKDVTDFGDVDKVLGRFYARVVSDAAKLGHNNEREIRNWVKSELVVAGGVRGQVLAAEAPLHEKTIEILDKTHLLRREPRRGADWLELAHDRLVPAVTKNNAAWLAENLSDLERRAEQWDIGGRSDDLLAVGMAYREMRAWAKENPARVKEAEQSFLRASRKKASGVMWRRILTGSTAVLAIASWIAMGYLNKAREEALAAKITAIEAAYKAVIAELTAQDAQEDALGDKQVADKAVLRANFSKATLLNERAEQAIDNRDYPAAWVYTLAALSENWPEGSNLQGLVSKMLYTEIRPSKQWKAQHEETVIVPVTKVERERLGSEVVAAGAMGHVVKYVYSVKRAASNSYQTGAAGFGASRSTLSVPGGAGSFLIHYIPSMNQFVKADKFHVSALTAQHPQLQQGSPPPISALADRGEQVAVIDANGDLRFYDRGLRPVAGSDRETHFSPSSMAFSRRNPDYFALGRGDGTVAIFALGKQQGEVVKLGSVAAGSRAIKSLTFLRNAPDILIAGADNGLVYVLSWGLSGKLRVLDSIKLHNGPVMALFDHAERGFLVSAGAESIRKTPLTFDVAGRRISVLDLMRNPRAKSSIDLYRYLLDDARRSLQRMVHNTTVVAVGNAERIPDADRLYYGAEPVSLPYRIPKGEFVRLPSGEWQWEREGKTTVLQSRSARELVDPSSKLSFILPGKFETGASVGFQIGSNRWRAAVESADKPAPNRIAYEEVYIEHLVGARWRVRAPGIEPGGNLTEAPESSAETVILGGQAGKMEFSRNGGPLRTGGIELFKLVRETGPASRSEHVLSERRMIYEAVSINGKGPIYSALPGERLVLEFRWRAEIADRRGQSCPGCFVQYYAGMRNTTPDSIDGFSKCIISENMPQDSYRGSSGVIRHEFKAPMSGGLFYITHRQSWEYQCEESQIERHSINPKDAIAVVRVAPE